MKGAFDVIWDYNGPDQGIYLKNSSTGTNAFTGTYYGNTSSDTDAFIGLNGANNPSYAGARSLLLGTNSSGAVAIMVGGTQVHTGIFVDFCLPESYNDCGICGRS